MLNDRLRASLWTLLCWTGVFFILALPLFATAVGWGIDTKVFAIVGSIFFFFGLLLGWLGRP